MQRSKIGRLARRNPSWATGIETAAFTTTSYFGALVIHAVTSSNQRGADLALLLCGGFLIVFFLTLVAIVMRRVLNKGNDDLYYEREIHRCACEHLCLIFRDLSKSANDLFASDLVNNAAQLAEKSESLMQSSVDNLFKFLDDHYGEQDDLSRSILFNVTFMTKSFIDGYLTIPVWASRDGKRPKSLNEREKKPDCLEITEAAKLYRKSEPEIRIVEDTETDPDYAWLYFGQKLNIKSAVIFPVKDDQSNLLGAVVAHCDQKRFFRFSEDKFWSEVIIPYAASLALARIWCATAVEKDAECAFF